MTERKEQWTPGPWRLGADLVTINPDWRDEKGNTTPDCLHKNGFAKKVATVGKAENDWRGIEQQVADGRLLAAAPDLYYALKEMVRLETGSWRPCAAHYEKALTAARAALTAATTETKGSER